MPKTRNYLLGRKLSNLIYWVREMIQGGASQTIGQADLDAGDSPQASPTPLPTRQVGTSSGLAMRRTIERLEISNLDLRDS